MAREVYEQIFQRLADRGTALNTLGDSGYVPRLAQRWEWSADSFRVTFHLDPRARWQDGHPVSAADVKFAFDVYTDSLVGSRERAGLRAAIDSISVGDSVDLHCVVSSAVAGTIRRARHVGDSAACASARHDSPRFARDFGVLARSRRQRAVQIREVGAARSPRNRAQRDVRRTARAARSCDLAVRGGCVDALQAVHGGRNGFHRERVGRRRDRGGKTARRARRSPRWIQLRIPHVQ